ncbi:hypothetical protein [Thermogemmatispora sp.]|uniref:hypothetical protein n=1 Tax=Thermogemmatispora sp. TaxID=1968838 RepID=UPI0035E40238
MGVIPLRRDQATLAMLGGCAACLLGFFLPWVELQGFDPLLPAQFMLNGTSIGLMTWLLLLLVLLQVVQLLGEPWLLKNNPRLIVWLPAAPLITGSFTLALAIYTLGIYFRLVGLLDLEALSGATPGSSVLAIRIGPGPYLILIGSLVILLAGFYRLAQLLLQARFPR